MSKTVNWTLTREKYIMDNYPAKTYVEIAADLGLTKDQVRHRHRFMQGESYGKMRVTRWPLSALRYLVANYQSKTLVELAAHFGVEPDILRKKLCRLRENTRRGKELFPVKYKKNEPDGTIRQRQDGPYIKRKGKWVRHGTTPVKKRGKALLPITGIRKEAAKRKKPVGIKASYGKPVKAEKKLRLASPDLSAKIPVKVDHKTTVYVNPGADINKVLERYRRPAL